MGKMHTGTRKLRLVQRLVQWESAVVGVCVSVRRQGLVGPGCVQTMRAENLQVDSCSLHGNGSDGGGWAPISPLLPILNG